MGRIGAVIMAACALLVLGADPEARRAGAAAPAKLAPDLHWRPHLGATANAWTADGSPIPATGDRGSAEIVAKALAAKDDGPIRRLRDSKTVFDVPSGTKVRIENQARPERDGPQLYQCELLEGADKGATAWIPGEMVRRLVGQSADIGATVVVGKTGERILIAASGPAHASMRLEARQKDQKRFLASLKRNAGRVLAGGFRGVVMNARSNGGYEIVKVHVADGPDAGYEGWVDGKNVRTVAAPDDPAPPATRGEAAMKLGRQFEKAGDKSAALEQYRRVLELARDSKEAAEAEDRILALGARP